MLIYLNYIPVRCIVVDEYKSETSLLNFQMKATVRIDPIEQHVIDIVRKLRRNKRMRQQDLARVLNTSSSFIGNVENGRNPAKYNLKHISRLAEYFDLSPRYFLPEDSIPSKKEILI
jgi:ribosome-binding protein aMBF1 (putative translation factor)